MKKIVVVLAIMFFAVSANALTIKLATLAPEQSPWYDVIRGMADDWKKATNGEVTVRIYAGGVVGDELSLIHI